MGRVHHPEGDGYEAELVHGRTDRWGSARAGSWREDRTRTPSSRSFWAKVMLHKATADSDEIASSSRATPQARQLGVGNEHQAFPRKVVDHGEDTEAATVCERVRLEIQAPSHDLSDNGTELTSRAVLQRFAGDAGRIALHRAGQATQYAFAESSSSPTNRPWCDISAQSMLGWRPASAALYGLGYGLERARARPCGPTARCATNV
jgi:hypothetical protein